MKQLEMKTVIEVRVVAIERKIIKATNNNNKLTTNNNNNNTK